VLAIHRHQGYLRQLSKVISTTGQHLSSGPPACARLLNATLCACGAIRSSPADQA
jgi:hypothetical protein